ncbi:Protein white, putative [Perkinsus marinus ATCC 50983]|nr:Protein white, putative [Perkinsus marinus ATCC 50983]EEQ98051.1 Protein white, putative [Perkinsus marinus ATCC 50983]|eukprot:XP_002765334.1 Protein white, putative [Perkinsus marinus ATCC 50983]
MLEYLRLTSCQTTMVGNQLTRGISGGERKRTSIGVELITQPSMIFLDEPLTGLDSYAAVTTSRILKGLARLGVTVLMTVHQPSSEVFELFDKVMVISEGEIAYHGLRTSLSDFFIKHAKLTCPPHYNLADFTLYTLQTERPEVIAGLVQAYKAEISDGRDANGSTLEKDVPDGAAHTRNIKPPYRAGLHKQFHMLALREFKAVMREPSVFIIRYIVVLFTTLLLGCIFHNAGRPGSELFWLMNVRLFQPYFSAVVMMCLMQLFGPAQTAIIRYPEQRMVFLREYTSGMYSVIPYVVSKTMVELPLALLECFLQVVAFYWIVNLQGNFVLWLLLLWLLNLVSTSLAQLLGATTSTITRAMQLMPLLFMPQIAFSGLFISLDRVPVWLRWGQYISYLKYGVNLGYFIEFGFDMPTLAKMNSIYANLLGLDIGVLLGMLILFRILTIVVLRRKARYVH